MDTVIGNSELSNDTVAKILAGEEFKFACNNCKKVFTGSHVNHSYRTNKCPLCLSGERVDLRRCDSLRIDQRLQKGYEYGSRKAVDIHNIDDDDATHVCLFCGEILHEDEVITMVMKCYGGSPIEEDCEPRCAWCETENIIEL